MYKRLTNIINAEVSESRNAPSNDASITIAGINEDIVVGDTVLLTQHLGIDIREFPFLVSNVEYERGNTIITGQSLLQQIFDCIIPDMAEQSGNAVDIIKAILTEANDEGFIDIYVNNMNFDVTAKSYTKVNVKNREVGEILQDICKDLGFVMWVGYDEINDKPNAFFFKDSVDIEQNHGTLKEGANIISEDLHKTNLDEIINYIFMYYYPEKYPFDEAWTEKCQAKKIYHALSTVHLSDIGTTRNIRIRNDAPPTTLTVDAAIGVTTLTVGSTAGFDADGDLMVDAKWMTYTSKDATHFYLTDALVNAITSGTGVYQYLSGTYPNVPLTEFVELAFYLRKDYPIKYINLNTMAVVASPQIKLRLWKSGGDGTYLEQVLLTDPTYHADVNWVVPEDGLYILGISSNKYDSSYIELGMGACASKTENTGDSEFQWWAHVGTPIKENFGLGDYVISDTSVGVDHTDPAQQVAIEIIMDDGGASLWTGNAYSNNTYKQWNSQELVTINIEGYDSLRIESGTVTIPDLSINTALYIQFHLWYRGGLSQIKLKHDVDNYWTFSFSEMGTFTEKTLKLTEGTKTGTPTTITSIEITVTSRAFIDSFYFQPAQEGTLSIVKDDASIASYHQHPKVLYAKGIVENSLATSLAQAIIDDNKDPQWAGKITVKDYPFGYTSMQKIKVIIGSKNLSETLDILKVTHYLEGNAELEVGKYQTDFGRQLAQLRSDMQNVLLTVGDTTVASESPPSYANHAIKHQDGGSDQVNIQGLLGELNGEQKSNWAKVTDKPTSVVGDIDDAVAKKHTQGTDQKLDEGGANEVLVVDVKDAVTKKHAQNTDTDLDAAFEATFAKKSDKLSVFAATTSAELAGVISDETGTDKLVYNTSPTLVTPLLGTPTSGVLTNCTGLPTAGLVDAAVTGVKASATVGAKSVVKEGITIATTGDTGAYIIAPEAGSLSSIEINPLVALATNDTNYITWTVVNLGQAGSGTTAMLAVDDANTTKATGGTALAVNTKRALTVHGTPANLVVAQGDKIQVIATASGTLANAVTVPVYILRFSVTA